MKRLIAGFLLLMLLPAGAWGEALPEALTLTVGESREFILPFEGYWDSDAPEVADARDNAVTKSHRDRHWRMGSGQGRSLPAQQHQQTAPGQQIHRVVGL